MQKIVNKIFCDLCSQVETNKKISQITKVNQSKIGKIRSGKSDASIEMLAALCKYLNCTINIGINPNEISIQDSELLTNI